jgi:hypothetical protein
MRRDLPDVGCVLTPHAYEWLVHADRRPVSAEVVTNAPGKAVKRQLRDPQWAGRERMVQWPTR